MAMCEDSTPARTAGRIWHGSRVWTCSGLVALSVVWALSCAAAASAAVKDQTPTHQFEVHRQLLEARPLPAPRRYQGYK